MELATPIVSERAPISGYRRGGFRVAGIEHPGSLLVLPDGVYDWPVRTLDEITEEALSPVLSTDAPVGFLILGTGEEQVLPSAHLRGRFAEAGLGLEAMDTGAACRTYNILLTEERVFAAALLALS